MVPTLWLLFASVVICWAQYYEGDSCVLNPTRTRGVCTIINDCPDAIDLIRRNRKPQTCGFRGLTPVVCCPATTAATTRTTTVVAGEKSQQKCKEYYPDTLYSTLVFGGQMSLAKEFIHMAIIGYGEQNNIAWLCGGSLISNNFVLTAAHCVYSQEAGPARWVRLGDLDIKNTTDDAQPQDFSIVDQFTHPQFRPPSHYHDIALFRLDKNAEFNEYVGPACLQADRKFSTGKLTATGWGKTEFLGESSSHLMKVDLDEVGHPECQRQYANVSPRRLSSGILDDGQICAGDPEGRDTCPGDSGGPLQYKLEYPKRFFIVGVTSFGRACGIESSAGVYTRVSNYVRWIENIVWAE